MKYFYAFLLIFFSRITWLPAADSSNVDYQVKVSKIIMDTPVETTARYPDVTYCKKALYFAYREMQRIDDLLAWQKPGSEIAKINAAAGKQPVHISEETFAILKRAVNYARKLDGLFDVTIGPVTTLWGFSNPEGAHLPQKNDIVDSLALVNYRDLLLNTSDTTAFLKKKGMRLDLGGIAKGYAIDRGSAILKEKGITNFILNAGGDIYVSGQKDKNTQWKVGVKDPRNGQKLIASFALKNYAVATSGDYERFIIVNGHRYHHIIDPRNGYPGSLSQSSTTFASTAEEADVMATYLFIIGVRQALKKETSAPFLIVDADGRLTANAKFKDLPEVQF